MDRKGYRVLSVLDVLDKRIMIRGGDLKRMTLRWSTLASFYSLMSTLVRLDLVVEERKQDKASNAMLSYYAISLGGRLLLRAKPTIIMDRIPKRIVRSELT